MQPVQLYINDQLADLSDDSGIELTFQINNLAEVVNQQGNTSKQFKLPLTQHNRRILGFPDDIKFTTSLPYTSYQCKVMQDGIEIIPQGIGEINGTEDKSVDFVVLSGNVDFFDGLGGSIYDMGDSLTVYGQAKVWEPYSHTWSVANVVNSQNKQDGWIWPIVDYGQLPLIDFTQPIDVRKMRPGFFLHTAIELLAKLSGYTINPDSFLLKQDLYKKLIVQFSNDNLEHGTDYQNRPDLIGMSAVTSPNQDVTHIPITDNKGILHFYNQQTDPSNQFDGTTFTAKQIMSATITVTIPKFYFKGKVTPSQRQSNVNILVYQHTPFGDVQIGTYNFDFSEGFTRLSGSGSNITGYANYVNKKITCEAQLVTGDQISIRYEFFGDRPANFTLYAGASFTIISKTVEVLYSQTIQCERIFPDVLQKDLLKDTLQRFGITCQTDNINKVITFSSFRDIVNNIPKANDWTLKCVDQGKKTTFVLGNYSQVNWLRYQQDDSIPLYTLPKYFADDKIEINNKTINPATPQTDLFTSLFAPSPNRPWYGGSIAQINKVDPLADNQDYTVSTAPRILIDQKLNLMGVGNKSVTFTDGTNSMTVNDNVSIPYFYKPDGLNLSWKDQPGYGADLPGLRNLYYPELENILKETKKVVRYFMLTAQDIAELDLLVPVYLEQDSAYYYINKIENWKKGHPVKVELIRL